MNIINITNHYDYTCPSGKLQTIEAPYSVLVAAPGEPFKNDPPGQNPDYPDDDYKTDVCWCIRGEDGSTLCIWNYKNGPAYNDGEGSIEELDYFSVGYDSIPLYEEVVNRIQAKNNGGAK